MKNTPVYVLLGAVLGVFFVALPVRAHADTIPILASQLGHEATSTVSWTTTKIAFGTGYSSRWTGGQIFARFYVTGAGHTTARIQLLECSDATYVTCTTKGFTGPLTIDLSAGLTDFSPTLSTSTPYTLLSSKYYAFSIDESGVTYTGGANLIGTQLTPTPNTVVCAVNCGGLMNAAYVVLADFAGTQFGIGYATSTSLFSGQDATSTLANLAQQCSQSGNLLAEGICIGFSFLFVPSPTVLNQFVVLANTTLPQKFPFSLFYGISSAFSTLTASSTANLSTVHIDFATVDPSATTTVPSFGPLLPNLTVLSTTTITGLMPSGFWTSLQFLIACALWITFGTDVFFTVRNKMHRV